MVIISCVHFRDWAVSVCMRMDVRDFVGCLFYMCGSIRCLYSTRVLFYIGGVLRFAVYYI